MITFGSVCSGIEAASVAWEPLGWRAAFFSEIEKFPCKLLQHRHPNVPNYGDMTKYHEWPDHKINLLAGGTPCQAFSVAGLREGLNDERGNLTLTFLLVARRYRPKWVVWENVPGVLSDRTNAFGHLTAGLAELGYGWAYRVLDAQHFGVPQRRRRVVLVGCLGGWERAATVLFEPESLSRDSSPRRGAEEEIAPALEASLGGVSGKEGRGLVVEQPYKVANCLTQRMYKGINTTLDEGQTPVLAFNAEARPDEMKAEEVVTLTSSQRAAVCFQESESGLRESPVSGTLRSGGPGHDPVGSRVRQGLKVRRLTPLECERLQGFPDGYTAITEADGPRYKALGNSWAVPVFRWVGRRIAAVEWSDS